MPLRSGRLEKRVPLAVPVQVSGFKDPAAAEQTISENVCSLGMRILARQTKKLNERLMISSLVGDVRALARVVYCQRLPDGRFGVGVQFVGQSVRWSKDALAGTSN